MVSDTRGSGVDSTLLWGTILCDIIQYWGERDFCNGKLDLLESRYLFLMFAHIQSLNIVDKFTAHSGLLSIPSCITVGDGYAS